MVVPGDSPGMCGFREGGRGLVKTKRKGNISVGYALILLHVKHCNISAALHKRCCEVVS